MFSHVKHVLHANYRLPWAHSDTWSATEHANIIVSAFALFLTVVLETWQKMHQNMIRNIKGSCYTILTWGAQIDLFFGPKHIRTQFKMKCCHSISFARQIERGLCASTLGFPIFTGGLLAKENITSIFAHNQIVLSRYQIVSSWYSWLN